MIKYTYKLLGLALCVSLVSCDYYDLENINPIDSVPTELAITNLQSANAARAGIYDELQDATLSFDGYLALPQLFSDECVFTGTFPTREEFAIYNVLTSNGTMNGVWADYYDAINVANNVLEVLPRVEDLTIDDDSRNSILAEARFARAFAYFNLIQGWNDVPLILTPTTTVGDELNVAKSSRSEVVTQIIIDCEFARDNLGGGSLGMNSAAANALLARLYLIEGNSSQAAAAATAALGGAGFELTAPYLEDEIFYLKFIGTDGNSNAFFYGTDDLNGRHSIEPSAKLIAAYEDGDLRKDMSVLFNAAGTPYGNKYNDFGSAGGSQTDPLLFFRQSEMVLILAEAAAIAGNFDTASDWINQVRTRAGLADVSLDANNFMDLILQERFVELAMEGGHRLWDLRRTGRAEAVLGPDGYDPCDNVWPLPQTDIDRNPNLVQNGCCNC